MVVHQPANQHRHSRLISRAPAACLALVQQLEELQLQARLQLHHSLVVHLPREGGGAREGGGDPRERRDATLDTAGGTLLNERAKAMERDSTRERDDDR